VKRKYPLLILNQRKNQKKSKLQMNHTLILKKLANKKKKPVKKRKIRKFFQNQYLTMKK
jgi:hypothetical protein